MKDSDFINKISIAYDVANHHIKDEDFPAFIRDFNWPTDAYVGHNVRLIYHMLLEEGVKVEKILEKSNNYKIYFTEGAFGLFKTLTLTPREL